jgi:hypothetical protein
MLQEVSGKEETKKQRFTSGINIFLMSMQCAMLSEGSDWQNSIQAISMEVGI